jgi:hypothetical protein
MDIQPIQYIKRNTDPEHVVSTVVAAFVLGGTLLVLRKSGIKAAAKIANIPK